MNQQDPAQPYHFKAGFTPLCPHCKHPDGDIRISLDENLHGPCNGPYEVIYCANDECHAFLGAHPIAIRNILKGIPEADKEKYPNKSNGLWG